MSFDPQKFLETYRGNSARPDLIVMDDVTDGPLRDGGHGFHPLKQRTTMKYIDIEVSDSNVVVYSPKGEMFMRLPYQNWATTLGETLRKRGYGYVPIREVRLGEHAAFTYYTASVTQRNIEEGIA